MRIDTMSLWNFRCFHRQNFQFHPELNVIIGENGAGKTAMLEALVVAIGGWLAAFPTLSSKKPTITSSDVRLTGQFFGNRISFEEENPTTISATGNVFDKNISWKYVRLNTRSGQMEGNEDELRDSAYESRLRMRDKDEIELPLIAYYAADRFARQEKGSNSTKSLTQKELSRTEGYMDCMTGHTSGVTFSRWMEYEARVAFQEEMESPEYRAVQNAMKTMIEGAEEIRFDNKRLEAVVLFGANDVRPFSQLSAGQRSMLALAGDMAARMSRLNPHLTGNLLFQTSGVVLIDELDLHLHPRWQRHVMDDLRRTFPKIQFIATTHSPQIISEIKPECVSILSGNEHDSVRITRPTQAYGLDTNGILENLMGADARPTLVQNRIDAVDDALEAGEWDQARALVSDLRQILHGDDPEVARLDASTATLEALADAVD